MRPAKGVVVAATLGLMVGLGLGGALKATPAEGGAAPRPEIWLDCPYGLAEDSAARRSR
jgi:hypothetical protein